MPDGNGVPVGILERILDKSDKATAAELAHTNTIIAALVNQLNTPPRLEDIHRIDEEIKKIIDEEVKEDLKIIRDSIVKSTQETNALMTRLKWITGIVLVVAGLASLIITSYTSITEKSIRADLAIETKKMSDANAQERQQRQDQFEALIKEIKKLHPVDTSNEVEHNVMFPYNTLNGEK